MKPLEIYIHIPFCVKKCNYCDFLSSPSTAKERQEYCESLCGKIRSYGSLAKAYRVVSVFVGGGTPSILLEGQMSRIFLALRDTFFIEEDAEITIEVNPGTVTYEKLKAYRQAGVNRLSIGLQSVRDEELKLLGRVHSFRDFLETYRMARETGFENINIDLISAIPGQTRKSWEQTLRQTAELEPEHISAYSLIIEEGTPFFDMYGEGSSKNDTEDRAVVPLPDEDEERLMYEDTKVILEQYGYERYEISNYAKKGYECRHNLGYWSRAEYLGIGTGASSLIENRRFIEGGKPEKLSIEDQMAEFMFLGLRKIKGVSKQDFQNYFGKNIEDIYGNIIKEMKKKKLVAERGDNVFLTERGIDVSNYVMSYFLL